MRIMRLGGAILATALMTVGLASPVAQAANSVTLVADPDSYTCGLPGFLDFENLPDGTDLSANAIDGVQFTTTGGFTWKVGDYSTGSYNGKYPSGLYTSKGTHWAWLGPDRGVGRIDFPDGKPSIFSLLTSANTSVYLEAYDRNGALLETAGPSVPNTGTGEMAELRIERSRADIDHVVIHDSGNYFTVDAICTNAKGVSTPSVKYRWAHLGDSYSAGVGLGKVTPDCDRDNGNYGVQAAADLVGQKLLYTEMVVAACTGATTADYWSQQVHEGPDFVAAAQRDAVTADVDIVTLTMGGNDAFLAKKVAGCFLGECGPDVYGVEAGTESVKTTWDDIFDRLVAMYTDIRTRMDRNGHLYVLSYPIPFNGTSNKCEGFTYNEQLAANAFATRIGDTIYLAVQAANNNLAASGLPGHVHFVDWRKGTRVENLYEVPSGYPDAGNKFPVVVTTNGLCGKKADSFLNGFQSRSWDPANPDRINSFHPNTNGQDFAAEILAKAVLADFGS